MAFSEFLTCIPWTSNPHRYRDETASDWMSVALVMLLNLLNPACIQDFIWFAKWVASWQNQQNGMCAQQRLRKAWVLSYPLSASEDSDQTGRMPRLIWVFAGRTVILSVLSWGSSNNRRFIRTVLLKQCLLQISSRIQVWNKWNNHKLKQLTWEIFSLLEQSRGTYLKFYRRMLYWFHIYFSLIGLWGFLSVIIDR